MKVIHHEKGIMAMMKMLRPLLPRRPDQLRQLCEKLHEEYTIMQPDPIVKHLELRVVDESSDYISESFNIELWEDGAFKFTIEHGLSTERASLEIEHAEAFFKDLGCTVTLTNSQVNGESH